jgi:hypothetical protein
MANFLDKNTLLTLNKNPKSIDLHNLALSRMKNVRVDPSAKHDFIADRARNKKLKNIDQVFQHLNELEKNGIIEMWMKKYGKKKYLHENQEIHIKFTPKFKKELVESIMSSAAPIAYMAGPQYFEIRNKYPKPTLTEPEKNDDDTKENK